MTKLILFALVTWSCLIHAAIVTVNIEAPGVAYPRRIRINKGDTIRFMNTLTANGVEHTITPSRATNAHLWFGGMSFYASDLGGLWVPYQEILGQGTGPFFTANWPEAEYDYYCQFHGGVEKGVLVVGNGAGRKPGLPPDSIVLPPRGCVANPSSCFIAKPASCQDGDIRLKPVPQGRCEPIDGTDGLDGVCVWPKAATENCFLLNNGDICKDGSCVQPALPPVTTPKCDPKFCTNFPLPSCNGDTLVYVADATRDVSCRDINGLGVETCFYSKTNFDCQTVGAKCVNGACTGDYLDCKPSRPDGSCKNAGEICINGACAKPTPPPCSPACAAGLICVDGQCKAAGNVCVPACGAGLICNPGANGMGVCGVAPCNAQNPNGPCPVDQKCSAGTCVSAPGWCSSAYPTGPCQAGAKCEAGICVTTSNVVVCSAQNPNGACSGGLVCSGGACKTPCSNGQCPTGFQCQNNVCNQVTVAGPCSVTQPGGTCPSGQVCNQGMCMAGQSPGCSATAPCPSSQQCQNGQCVTPTTVSCSPSAPTGFCANSAQSCVNGVCTDGGSSVTCSAANCASPKQCVNGKCETCSITPAQCQTLQALCTTGSITCGCNSAPPCPTAPATCANPCTATQECKSGVCVEKPVPCSDANPGGVCDMPGFACLKGTVTQSFGCTAVCSEAYPTGGCAIEGLTCFPSTTAGEGPSCSDPLQPTIPCSPRNPQGPCPTGKLCQPAAGGGYMCQQPGASSTTPSPPAKTCNMTPDICKKVCGSSAVMSCNCATGVMCFAPTTEPTDTGAGSLGVQLTLVVVLLTLLVAL